MHTNLHYTDTGHGETTLLFLHYFGGSSHTWKTVIALLKNSARCIAIDLPGFGDSAPVEGEPSVENTVAIVEAFINQLAVKNFVLIGHSMGGKIALAIAAKKPQGLQQLILVAPSPPTPEPMDAAKQKSLEAAFADKEALKKLATGLVAKPLVEEQLAAIVQDNLRIAKKAWDGWIYTGSQEDISSQVKSINVPLTVISGDSDPNFSTSFLKETFSRYFPNPNFIEIKEAGHLIPIEQPQAVADVIKQLVV